MVDSLRHPFADVARQWLTDFQACVRAVDYERARPMFAEDAVGFGTYAAVVVGQPSLEREQWRNVWWRIRDFTFRLADLHCFGDEHALCAILPWDSLGVRPDGSTFERPGRATIMLMPRDSRWVAVHSHFSLAPTPG